MKKDLVRAKVFLLISFPILLIGIITDIASKHSISSVDTLNAISHVSFVIFSMCFFLSAVNFLTPACKLYTLIVETFEEEVKETIYKEKVKNKLKTNLNAEAESIIKKF
jgi:Na+/H+-dicarboxylate symporter